MKEWGVQGCPGISARPFCTTMLNFKLSRKEKQIMDFEIFRQIFQVVHKYHDVFAELLSLLLKCSNKDAIK